MTALSVRLLSSSYREVFKGVSADGVGVKFPIFPVNCSCLALSYESKEKNEEKRKRKAKKNEKKGARFPPASSTPTPLRTSQS